jgi:sugar phosphate isomerase/epimerase
MKIGFQPFIEFSGYIDAFEFAEKEGFDAVEFHMDLPQFSYQEVEWKDVADVISSYDISVLLHASTASTNILSPNRFIREASLKDLEKTCEFSQKIGGDLVTFHLGWSPMFYVDGALISLEKRFEAFNYKIITEELKKMVDQENSLSMENTIDLGGMVLKGVKELIETTDIKVTFDMGHANINPTHNFLYKRYLKKIRNVHLHDNDGEKDEHLPLGKGTVKTSNFPFEDYTGYVIFETRPAVNCVKSKKMFISELGSRV